MKFIELHNKGRKMFVNANYIAAVKPKFCSKGCEVYTVGDDGDNFWCVDESTEEVMAMLRGDSPKPGNGIKVAVTIKGCIDLPSEWLDPDKEADYAFEVAEYHYNEQLSVEDAIDDLARKLKAYPEDLEVRISAED